MGLWRCGRSGPRAALGAAAKKGLEAWASQGWAGVTVQLQLADDGGSAQAAADAYTQFFADGTGDLSARMCR